MKLSQVRLRQLEHPPLVGGDADGRVAADVRAGRPHSLLRVGYSFCLELAPRSARRTPRRSIVSHDRECLALQLSAMLDPAMATAAPLEGIETTAEVAVIAEVAGQPVGNEALAVVAEPMTADGLPANGRALARTGEHKSDRWRATKWHLVYRGHLDHERLLQRVAVATHVPLAAWSVVHRTTEDEGDLTLFGLMFKAGIDVQGKGVFDVPGADGQTSIRPTASTMKSVSWLKSIFEEHRTLPAIGRWQKYPDDNDWGDCRPKRKRDSFEGCAARRSPAPAAQSLRNSAQFSANR